MNLMDCIGVLENALGKEANKEFLPIQPGDVSNTEENVSDLVEWFECRLHTLVERDIANFAVRFEECCQI